MRVKVYSIELPTPGWLRRHRRLARVGAAALIFAGLLTPGALFASDKFSDVPTDNGFHDDVDALVNAGVTSGCRSDAYCPANGVTRGQMAGFLHRGLGRTAVVRSTTPVTLEVEATPVATFELLTGGVPAGGTTFVKLDATLTVTADSFESCPCTVTATIFNGEGVIGTSTDTISSARPIATIAVTAVDAVPSGTTRTYTLQGSRNSSPAVIRTAPSAMTAIAAPFGSMGGNIF